MKANSRHAAIGTLLIYADEHDRQGTHRTLADLIAKTLATADGAESPPVASEIRAVEDRVYVGTKEP